MRKYIAVAIIIQFSLISCSNVEIISDPYWNTLISEFQGMAVGLKFQSFFNGNRLNLTVAEIAGTIPELRGFTESGSDIYLLSPLLSVSVLSIAEARSTSVFYYFGSINSSIPDSSDNIVVIERDRRTAFFDAGRLAAKEIENDSVLAVVYDAVQKEEALSFLDRIEKNDKNISVVSLEVKSNTPESEIRSFFDEKSIKSNSYVAIFTAEWKNICYELSERDSKQIITSDSWFNKTYEPLIIFSIEDDIKGMMKKVYNNMKTGKHTDITLDGFISR